MTDFVRLAQDTLTASQAATRGAWWEDTSIRDGLPIVMASDGLVARLERSQLSQQEADAEFIALMRTAGPLLAQHVLDLREALAFYAEVDHWAFGDQAQFKFPDGGYRARAALSEKEPRIQRAGEKHEDRGVPRYDHP